jgi:hypothetical protein
MFGQNRTAMRRLFTDAWRKFQAKESMQPLERVIASIVQQHPEYHQLLNSPEQALEQDFLPEYGNTNPFLHMGMHITLQEQTSTDRPPGISNLYQLLSHKTGDHHTAEHQIMECLGKALWEAQQGNTMPNEQEYLECVRRLVGHGS